MHEYRNAKYNRFGSIDCEINHPEFGWIPYTASPDDAEVSGRDLFAEIHGKGAAAAHVLDVEQLRYDIGAKVDELMDAAALADGFRGSSDALSFASFGNSLQTKAQAFGVRVANARAAVDDYIAGNPVSVDDFLATVEV